MTDFTPSSNDGGIYGYSASYATARSVSQAYFDTAEYFAVGQSQTSGAIYYVYRSYFKFDTSSIPDTDTVTQVNLKMTAILKDIYTGRNFDIQIIKCDWSAWDPIGDAADREAIYDCILSSSADSNIFANTADLVVNTPYTSGNLNTAWINKTGDTYYGLRSSADYNSDPPGPTRSEIVRLGSSENATPAYKATLIVTHSAAGTFVPRVTMFFSKPLNLCWLKKGGLWQPQEMDLITI
jgi:hypothetical protein